MVNRASRLPTAMPAGASLPAASVPLACSCDALQRAQQRLQALASQAGERIDRLQRAFEQLPAAANFDPFAVQPTGPAPDAGSAGSVASRPAGTGPTLPALVDSAHRPLRRPATAGAGGQRDARPGAVLGLGAALAGATAAVASAAVVGAQARTGSLTDWLDPLARLAVLGGEQVAQLMQRHAAPPPVTGLGAISAAALARLAQAEAQPASPMGRMGARLPGGNDGSARARTRQSTPPPDGTGPDQPSPQGLGQLLGEALAGSGWSGRSKTQDPAGGSRAAALVTAPELLERLLTQGLGGAVGGLFGAAAEPGPPMRQAAPRAASRLVGAQTSTAHSDARDPARAPADDAPAAAALEAQDAGEAMAQQISRLLLDQAWMRGVDLR